MTYPHTIINVDGKHSKPMVVNEDAQLIADRVLVHNDGFMYCTELGTDRPVIVNTRYVTSIVGLTAEEAPQVRDALRDALEDM